MVGSAKYLPSKTFLFGATPHHKSRPVPKIAVYVTQTHLSMEHDCTHSTRQDYRMSWNYMFVYAIVLRVLTRSSKFLNDYHVLLS